MPPLNSKIPEFIQNEFNENEFDEVDLILSTSENFNYPKLNSNKAWNNLSNQLSVPSIPFYKTNVMKWAVAAVLFMTIGVGVYFLNNNNTATQLVYNSQNKIQTIKLEDGSIVYLNRNSQLTVIKLEHDFRQVKIEGEARFEVSHNQSPFEVIASDKVIRVLGTVFNVKNINNTPFEVALFSGKIELEANDYSMDLTPGYKLVEQKGEFFKDNIEYEKSNDWLDNKLVFKEAVLSDIINELETVYQVKFDYNADLNKEKLSISFEGLSANDAAKLLSKTLNSTFTIK